MRRERSWIGPSSAPGRCGFAPTMQNLKSCLTMFLRSLLRPPGSSILACIGGHRCPDILEMESGDFAVIGEDISDQAIGRLPPGSGCGDHERIVRIPRSVLARAKGGIPDSV